MPSEMLQDKTKRYLQDNGMMQKFFAEKINVSQPMFSMWLRNKVSFSTETIKQIRELISNN